MTWWAILLIVIGGWLAFLFIVVGAWCYVIHVVPLADEFNTTQQKEDSNEH